jgi:hypothetical protein
MEPPGQGQNTPTITTSVEKPLNRVILRLGLLLGVILIIATLVGVVYFLLLDTTPTSTIRDILIIFMAFELSVIGIAVILLIIQIARLINLFQNEIKPLLESANETMGTLRGTAIFLGDSLVQPVIKANSYLAVFQRVLDLLNINR